MDWDRVWLYIVILGVYWAWRYIAQEDQPEVQPVARPSLEPAPDSDVGPVLAGLVCIWTRVAEADGALSAAERNRMSKLLGDFLTESRRAVELGDAEEFIDIHADPDDGESIDACLARCRGNETLTSAVLETCWAVAVADHDVSPEETAAIGSIASRLGVSSDEAEALAYPFTRTDIGGRIQEARRILGVSIDTTDSEIKKAFRRLAALYHPDKHTHAAEPLRELTERKFQEISAAYTSLKNRSGGWFGLDSKGRVAQAKPGMTTRCPFCTQNSRLPPREERLEKARCGVCYRLLLHDRAFIEELSKEEAKEPHDLH